MAGACRSAAAATPTSSARVALAAFLLRCSRRTLPSAANLLDDRDRAEDDHERQDAVELGVAAEVAEDARARRAGRRARRVLAEAGCVDTGIRVASRRPQGWQRAPGTSVVVLDLLEGPRGKPHGQVIARYHHHWLAARLAHARDAIDISADLDPGGRSRRIRIRGDRALHAGRTGRRLEGAGSEIHDHLAVAGLHAATGDLAVQDRQRRLTR